ncbi:HAD-IIA family hydrolase [Chloroflexi bacterium TSY]|nr:HAD-IIA family hydrolase [Chloroflexi bacterium TSY]
MCNLAKLVTKKAFICDMDGVIYEGNTLLPGVLQFVEWLKQNKKFLFLTNNSTHTPRELCEKLLRLGVDVTEEHIYTASLATAEFLSRQTPNGTVFVIGDSGLTNALYDAGFSMNESNPDYVVVGRTQHYCYQILEKAVQLVNNGAHLIGANPDAYFPTENGFAPSTGALVAPIEIATGKKAYFVGKPNPLMMRLALDKIGCHSSDAVMIGDRMDTDILSGIESQLTTVLVLSGAMTRDDMKRFGFRPDYVLDGVRNIALAVQAEQLDHRKVSVGDGKSLTIFQKAMFLKTTDFFASTPEGILAKIAPVLEEIELEAGTTILEHGKPNPALYMIVDGEVRIYRGKQEIAKRSNSETFGEMGMLEENSVASATVTTVKPTRLIRLKRKIFFRLLNENPDVAQNTMLVLLQRLRNTDAMLEQLSTTVVVK